MEMETKKVEDLLVITPHAKRIDTLVAEEFITKFLSHCAPEARGVILNLSKVEFIDSRGIGALISIFKKVEGRGSLFFCNVRGPVTSLLHLTRMDKVFTIYDNEQEAIQQLISKEKAYK